MSPRHLYDLLKDTVTRFIASNTTQLGAALAYYAVFSVAPLELLAVALAGAFYGNETSSKEMADQLKDVAGRTVADAIQETVLAAQEAGTGKATAFGLIAML